VFLVGDGEVSFDSRHFCALSADEVVGVVVRMLPAGSSRSG
jgi:type IV secretory pathway protease TraF